MPSLQLHMAVFALSAYFASDEIVQEAEDVNEGVVHGNKVDPWEETRIVPFSGNGCFNGDPLRAQEGQVAPTERIAVDVGEVFVTVLVIERDAWTSGKGGREV